MVSAAANPIAGDKMCIRLAVGSDCRAEIRSLSATIARRGPAGTSGPSSASTVVRIGPRASLIWSPEPGVAAEGANHRTDTRVWLEPTARLAWREEWTLGRYGEEAGTWRSRNRVTIAGRPLLTSDLASGTSAAGWARRSVLAGARAVSTLTLVDPVRLPTENRPRSRASSGSAHGFCVPLSGPAVQVMAWGDDLADCQATVTQLLDMNRLCYDLSTVRSPATGIV
jgi:urease accessory protein UreH